MPLRRAFPSSHGCFQQQSTIANNYGWNPATNPAPDGPWRDQVTVEWPLFQGLEDWLASLDMAEIEQSFDEKGFAVVEGIIPPEVVPVYANLHDRMHSGEIDAKSHRHDLGGHKDAQVEGKENVGQIMWPTDLVKNSRNGPLHERAFAVTRHLMGQDTAFDFDMLIYKDPNTNTETPWHQDEACEPAQPHCTAGPCHPRCSQPAFLCQIGLMG